MEYLFNLILLLLVTLIGINDAKTGRIPDKYNIAIAVFGLLNMIMSNNIYSHIVGAIIISIPMFLINEIEYRLSKSEHKDYKIGGGDIKLMAAIGLFVGSDNPLFNILNIYGLAIIIMLIKRVFSKSSNYEKLGVYIVISTYTLMIISIYS